MKRHILEAHRKRERKQGNDISSPSGSCASSPSLWLVEEVQPMLNTKGNDDATRQDEVQRKRMRELLYTIEKNASDRRKVEMRMAIPPSFQLVVCSGR